MAKDETSIYPQFLQLRKNQIRHSMGKQIVGPYQGRQSKMKVQNDTDQSPDIPDEQKAAKKTIRKMGNNAYSSDLNDLMGAYGGYGSGDGGGGNPKGGA